MKGYKLLYWMFVCIPLIVNAQDTSTSISVINGIQWITGLNWDQVKQKAKEENKYVFIDAYATWCGPCKAMDKEVYMNDTIGDFVNKNFISIKIQMDKTDNDNGEVKSWYKDAELINKKYKVETYPSLIFLSPRGEVALIDNGFKNVQEFIALANSVLTPNSAVKNSYEDFSNLVKQYETGNKHFDRIPFMVKYAIKLNEHKLALQLIKEHTEYILKLKKSKRYTRENIEMWTLFVIGSDTKVFKFFYEDGDLIDKVMNRKGFSKEVVGKTIKDEIVDPFFIEQNKNKSLSMTGMYKSGGDMTVDTSEADWKKLKRMISGKFKACYVDRNVLSAKIEWYKRHLNYIRFVEHSLIYFDKYFILTSENAIRVNNTAFYAFNFSTDKRIIDRYIGWMQRVVKIKPSCANIDTYANLLYKAGRTQEALEWEQKAVDFAIGDQAFRKQSFLKVIEQMKKGEPTWGAAWGYK